MYFISLLIAVLILFWIGCSSIGKQKECTKLVSDVQYYYYEVVDKRGIEMFCQL